MKIPYQNLKNEKKLLLHCPPFAKIKKNHSEPDMEKLTRLGAIKKRKKKEKRTLT